MVERVPPLRIKVKGGRSPSPWLYVIIFLLFMGILLVLFLQSPLSQIKKVQINGNRLVTKEQILKTTNLDPEGSFFYANSSQMKRKLENLPEIQQVKIEKIFPNKIHINVQEFPVIAYVQRQDGWFVPILWNGTMLSDHQIDDLIAGVPTIQSKDRTSHTVQLALRNLLRVPKHIRTDIEFVHSLPNHVDQVKLVSKYHHQIYIRAKKLHKKLIYYPQFRKHPPGKLYLLQSIWFRPE